MLRAYIVDDEALAVERLTRLLQKTGRVQITGATTDPEAAVKFLGAHDVDVVFLDIQMPALTGFDVLDELARAGRDVRVIFTTAYDRYAIDAFTVNSVDYLLKPIQPERLDKALDKLEQASAQARGDLRALARELALQLAEAGSLRAAPDQARAAPTPRRLERIASRVGERTTLVEVARVTHFFSKDKLTFAAAAGREHVIDFTLSELEDRLDRRFVRIHRGTIVNIGFVQEIHPGIEGILVRLKDEHRTELPVARDRVKVLKERLGI
jgi:DNA-binding LytR/AlgR family response regulator